MTMFQYGNLPLRMSLVKVKISQLQINHTYIDPVFKEAGGRESYKEVELEAQNNVNTMYRRTPSRTGDEVFSMGHLVFRKTYLKEKGVTIKRHDKITEIDGDKVNYDIVEIRNESALGGHNLLTFAEYRDAKERASV